MARRPTSRGSFGRVVTLAVVVSLISAGCTWRGNDHEEPVPTDSSSSSAVARTRVSAVEGKLAVTVRAVTRAEIPESARTFPAPDDVPVAIGTPVSLETEGSISAAGVTISRTYPEPLPDGWSATLAYLDVPSGEWRAVPSTLSSDRRAVSAVVHHFSIWTDITGGIGTAAAAVGKAFSASTDWLYYQAGSLIDTRVGVPDCSGKPPTWVDSAVFTQPERNDALLFCVGHDPKKPDLVDVKVRVNRGYAYDAYLDVGTRWTYDSTFAGGPLQDAIDAADLGGTFAKTMSEFAPSGSVVVGPGEELSFGADEQDVRAGGTPSLRLVQPAPAGFLVSVLGELVGQYFSLAADGYTAAGIAVASCYDTVEKADSAVGWARALATCVDSVGQDALEKKLAAFLTERGLPASRAGAVVGRVSVFLALLGPVIDSSRDYSLDSNLPDSARSVSIYPTRSSSAGGLVYFAPPWPGRVVSTPADARALTGVPQDFREFLAKKVADDCSSVTVQAVSSSGWAVGSDNGCGAASALVIWKRTGGTWASVAGTQDGFGCSELHALRVPVALLQPPGAPPPTCQTDTSERPYRG